jgi:hypothetical protein
MNKIYYKQCVLEKENTIQYAWIPKKFAKQGKYVILDNENGTTWKVKIVFAPELEESYLIERGQDYKHTRKASDI